MRTIEKSTMRNILLPVLVVLGLAFVSLQLTDYGKHVMIVGIYYVIIIIRLYREGLVSLIRRGVAKVTSMRTRDAT